MFTDYECYTVSWVPASGDPLATFGCGWTGWCADTGEKCARMPSPLPGLDVEAITRDVARSGLHAGLTAPFRLDDPHRKWQLERTLVLLADRLREIVFRGFEVAVAGGRVALLPRTRVDELDALRRRACEAVAPIARAEPAEDFAPGRDEQAHARRHRVALKPTGCFHLPLTDRLAVPTACQVAARLRPLLAEVLEPTHVVADIALVTNPGAGMRARIQERYPLSDQVRGRAYSCRGPRLIAPLILGERADAVPG